MMKKFGSNWKKLASNITNVKRQSSNADDDTFDIPSIVATGNVHNYGDFNLISELLYFRMQSSNDQLF